MSLVQKIKNRCRYVMGQWSLSPDIKDKLLHNYHTLTWLERLLYFARFRKHFSQEQRFFFEGERGLIGQMYSADRKGLYDTILTYKPRYCIEIGTWTGGGSTYFLTKAFQKLGAGKLYTIESDDHLYKKAHSYYDRHIPEMNEHITFLYGNTIEIFKEIIESYGGLDSFFLDGAEDSEESLRQYTFLKSYCKPGTLLMAHDWNTEKMKALKPILLKDPHWKLITLIEPPLSVGFVVFQYQ